MSLKEQAEALGIEVDGRWGDKRIQEEIDKAAHNGTMPGDVALRINLEPSPSLEPIKIEPDEMNALAMRIWEGQSISLPEKERVTRIIKALREKGYEDLSDLDLPVDMSRYI